MFHVEHLRISRLTKQVIMIFTFTIKEKSVYWQEGTIDVEAETLEEAKRKALKGEYAHHGDNEIDYNTEKVIEREITQLN